MGRKWTLVRELKKVNVNDLAGAAAATAAGQLREASWRDARW
jgi:hypothetical protein